MGHVKAMGSAQATKGSETCASSLTKTPRASMQDSPGRAEIRRGQLGHEPGSSHRPLTWRAMLGQQTGLDSRLTLGPGLDREKGVQMVEFLAWETSHQNELIGKSRLGERAEHQQIPTWAYKAGGFHKCDQLHRVLQSLNQSP